MEKMFSDESKRDVLRVLEASSFQRSSIFFEEQDDGQSLSIYVPLDEYLGDVSTPTLLNLAKRVGTRLPSRPNDYSWYVIFTCAGKIVESYFGGNASAPDSGF